MIKAIIFDCYGVLVESSLEPFIYKFLAHDKELVIKAREIDCQSCIGKISRTEMIKIFSELAQIPIKETEAQFGKKPSNKELIKYIEHNLKSKYKIGFLSNAAADRMNEHFNTDEIELFDDIVLSFEVGYAKPDKEIFKLVAEKLGVEPEECVFTDDHAAYLNGAKKVGMKTILYTDFESFEVELVKVLNYQSKI